MSELYELPNGWEWKKLSDIGKISTGKTPPKANKEYYENGTIRFVKPPNLQNYFEITELEADEFITEDGAKKSTLLPKNSLMVCCIGSLGKFALSTETVITNQQINSIVFNDKVIHYKYGYYYGFMFEKLLNEVANEAVVKIVNKTIFSNLDIPLPPLSEQQRIVSKLDKLFKKIDKAIALHQKNMDEADVFMGSVLNEVFGELEEKYGFYKLDEVCKFSQGIQVPTNEQLEEYKDGLHKFVRIINYTQLSDEYRYVEKYSEKAFVNEDDIVMVRYGATAGFIGKGQKGLLANNLFRVIPNENYTNDFIYYGIKNPKNQSTMYNNIGAAAMPAVNFGTMSLLTIPNISISIQQKVVKYLDEISEKIEKVKSVQKEKMDSLKALKASILDKAFRGEL